MYMSRLKMVPSSTKKNSNANIKIPKTDKIIINCLLLNQMTIEVLFPWLPKF